MSRELKYDPTAYRDPNCKACKQGWPVHSDGGSKRVHMNLYATAEGVVSDCPTQDWPDDEFEDDPATETPTTPDPAKDAKNAPQTTPPQK